MAISFSQLKEKGGLRLREQWNKLAQRERWLVLGGIVIVAIALVIKLSEPVIDGLNNSEVALIESQSRVKLVPATIEKYLKLKQRREAVEKRFREVEFKEGPLSFLEKLVQEKAGVAKTEIDIKPGPERPFGGSYEQLTHTVRFKTADLGALVGFLKELARGPRPMIIARIDIKRSRLGDKLEVDLDVSSLRKSSNNSATNRGEAEA